jgi:hypothetical protein
MVRWQLHVVAPVLLVLFAALPAVGNTLTVTTTADSGAGSLRAAIASASPGDTIDFNLTYPTTITLSSTIWVTTSMTISGPGADKLAISGNNAVEVLYVTGGANVAISGVTIENGSALSGGGIMVFASTLTLTDSAVSGNSAAAYNGGAIFNFDQATLVLNRSTVSGNSAGGNGGGIANYQDSALTIINSTVAANSAGSMGGAIVNDNSALTLVNSTVEGNAATASGGGIANNNGTLTIKSSIVALNKGGNCSLSSGPVTSDGYNLSDDTSCSGALTSTTDSNNVSSAGLDSKGLQNNGGTTSTIALSSTSPAVDSLPTADCTLTDGVTQIATDQRGVTRPQGAACDIGAFELVQSTAFSSFNVKLDIDGGADVQTIHLHSTFSLASGSSGINPLTEDVKLQVGTYQVTIPAGSFHQLGRGAKKACDVFEGRIGGTVLSLRFVPLGGNNYRFRAFAAPVNLETLSNPVKVSLAIGSNQGTATVTADFSR